MEKNGWNLVSVSSASFMELFGVFMEGKVMPPPPPPVPHYSPDGDVQEAVLIGDRLELSRGMYLRSK